MIPAVAAAAFRVAAATAPRATAAAFTATSTGVPRVAAAGPTPVKAATGPRVTAAGPGPVEPIQIPRVRPVGPPEGVSSVAAFDRPQAVVVVGPKPLPVTFVGPVPSGPAAFAPKPQVEGPEWAKRITDGFRMAGQVASGAGQAATGIAQGSATAAFSSAVGVATVGLSRLGPQGVAAAAGLQAVTTGVEAFRSTVAAFVNRSKEIGGYDGRIAGASAMAEVRKINSDMREAQRLGDQLSKLVTAQSKSEAMWDEILLVIKGPIIKALTEGVDVANQALAALVTLANKMTFGKIEWLDQLAKQMGKILSGEPGDILDARIREFLNAPLGGYVAPVPAGVASGGMPPLGIVL